MITEATPSSQALADNFKSAMRQLAATVTIVTSVADGASHGMTATAVTSLSMEPPSLLVCVNRAASLHAALAPGRRFCVNILGRAHQDLSMVFGGRVEGNLRFEHGNWATDPAGVPYLQDASALVFCSVERLLEYGTHSIVIGDVLEARAQSDFAPLIHGNGRFLSAA